MVSGKVNRMRGDEQYGRTASGQPIAEDLIDELVAKVEAGYDVGELMRRRFQPTPRGDSSNDL
jgi:hypothetical protein